VFGQDILLEPKSGGSYTVRGVFRRTFVSVDPDTQQPVTSTSPLLVIQDTQMPSGEPPAEGDVFTIEGTRWKVSAPPELEGEGTSRVYLRKA